MLPRDIEPNLIPIKSDDTQPIPNRNRIIDVINLKEVVENNLGPCNICKKGTLVLEENRSASFATTLRISCNLCEDNKSKLQNSIGYISDKMESLKIKTKADVRDRIKLQQKIYRSTAKLTKLDAHISSRTIYPEVSGRTA